MKSITDIKLRLARIVACSNSTTRETPKDHKKATERDRGFLTTDNHGCTRTRRKNGSPSSLIRVHLRPSVVPFSVRDDGTDNHECHETTQIAPKAGQNPFSPPRLRATSGFSLVEIVIAIGVAAFCLVAMLGLIPTGLKSVRTSVTETTATEALAAVAADLRTTQPGSNNSPNYNIPLPPVLGMTNSTNFYLTQTAALVASSNDLSAQFGVMTTLSNSTPFLTTARIQVYWPPTAPVTNAQGTVETVISFNRD